MHYLICESLRTSFTLTGAIDGVLPALVVPYAAEKLPTFLKDCQGREVRLVDQEGFDRFLDRTAYASLADAQAEIARLRAALEALESIGVLEDGLIGSGPEIEHAQALAREALK